jgi:predicted nuclease with RNAse H fold
MVVLGVDLRSSPNHPSAVAVIGCQSEVAALSAFHEDDELVQIAKTYLPEFIAIGTPLGLPEGLCCLEPGCQCQFTVPNKKGRQLELELSRRGISCFFTNKGSIIRNLIYRGIGLSQQLQHEGFEVIEVYPHATKVILFGGKIPPKNSAASLSFMKEHLAGFLGGLEPHLDTLDRNSCDALVNGYTAFLHSRHSTDVLGTAQEGLLALPRLVP